MRREGVIYQGEMQMTVTENLHSMVLVAAVRNTLKDPFIKKMMRQYTVDSKVLSNGQPQNSNEKLRVIVEDQLTNIDQTMSLLLRKGENDYLLSI